MSVTDLVNVSLVLECRRRRLVPVVGRRAPVLVGYELTTCWVFAHTKACRLLNALPTSTLVTVNADLIVGQVADLWPRFPPLGTQGTPAPLQAVLVGAWLGASFLSARRPRIRPWPDSFSASAASAT